MTTTHREVSAMEMKSPIAPPAEMDAVLPWIRLLAPIEAHYPKVGPKALMM